MTPIIILHRPQLGENIGMVARAMGNFGAHDLRLIQPRDGWPSDSALRASAGADWIVEKATVWQNLKDAIKNVHFLVGTTARNRRLEKNVFTPQELVAALNPKETVAFLFGEEQCGLSNEELSLVNAVIRIPTDPKFSSLNLAQSVLLCLYEFRKKASVSPHQTIQFKNKSGELATFQEILGFLEHLEYSLDQKQFFRPTHKKKKMVHNLRNIFQRIDLTAQEVRTLRGVIRALESKRHDHYS